MDQPGQPPHEVSVAMPGGAAPEMVPRRFAIGDAMIVVAVAACLLAWFSSNPSSPSVFAQARNYWGAAPGLVRYLYFSGPLPSASSRSSLADVVDYVWMTPASILLQIGLPPLVFSTLAFPPIRLRKPRPPWRDLLRQPGTVAILSVILWVLVEVDLRWMFGVEVPTPMPVNTALVVIAAWLILGVTRLWRGEPGWVDRLGRALGVGWIAVGLLFALILYRAV